jgi:dolichol kinase
MFPLAYAAGAGRRLLVVVLGASVVVALLVEAIRARHERMRRAFERITGEMLRAHERRALSGATWLAMALFGAVTVFPRDVAIATMWAAAVGDALAALVGRAFGRFRLGAEGKSAEGSITCFTATLVGAYAVAHLSLAESIVSAITAAGAEFPRRPWDDNVRIVAATGSAILLWRIVFS